jgi:hypothetical protein
MTVLSKRVVSRNWAPSKSEVDMTFPFACSGRKVSYSGKRLLSTARGKGR